MCHIKVATKYLEAFSSKDSTAMKGGIREDHREGRVQLRVRGVLYASAVPRGVSCPRTRPTGSWTSSRCQGNSAILRRLDCILRLFPTRKILSHYILAFFEEDNRYKGDLGVMKIWRVKKFHTEFKKQLKFGGGEYRNLPSYLHIRC